MADEPLSESERLDRNRLEFLRTEVETCFTLIGVGETEQDLDDPENAHRSLQHAEAAYATVVRFMSDPKHSSRIGEQQRKELTAAVARLRAMLDRLAKELKA